MPKDAEITAQPHGGTSRLAEAFVAIMIRLQMEQRIPVLRNYAYTTGVTATETERSSGLEISDRNGCLLAQIGALGRHSSTCA
jgi:hypothetical protein